MSLLSKLFKDDTRQYDREYIQKATKELSKILKLLALKVMLLWGCVGKRPSYQEVLRRPRLGAGARRGVDLLYNQLQIGDLLSIATGHSCRHLRWRRLLRRLLRRHQPWQVRFHVTSSSQGVTTDSSGPRSVDDDGLRNSVWPWRRSTGRQDRGAQRPHSIS